MLLRQLCNILQVDKYEKKKFCYMKYTYICIERGLYIARQTSTERLKEKKGSG